jgi:hypothetical protein
MIALILDDASNILAHGITEFSDMQMRSQLTITKSGLADVVYILNATTGARVIKSLVKNPKNRHADCILDNCHLSAGDNIDLVVKMSMIN